MHSTEKTCASSRRRCGTTRFVTFSCLGRRHWLAHGAARDTVARMIADGARGDDVRLHAWVVMSNHLHFLASDAELPVLSWAASLRKRFALHERKAIAWCLPEEARTGPFWLRGGGYARVIWSWQEYLQKLRYIHENPVRAGLCARMSAWRWSSAIDVYAPPRADMPVLTPPPEHLIDLLWWKQPCIDRETW